MIRGRVLRKSSVSLLAIAWAVVALLACGGSSEEPVGSPTAPAGMFSTLPTEESPVLGDQPPTIELNTPEPTLTPQPTPTPNPTYTPASTLTPLPSATPVPTLAPTGTPVPTLTPEPTGTPVPTAIPNPTATPNPSATPVPTSMPTAAPTPAPTKASTSSGTSSDLDQALCATVYGTITVTSLAIMDNLLEAGAGPDVECGGAEYPILMLAVIMQIKTTGE